MKIMGAYYRNYFSSNGLPGKQGCAAAGLAFFRADSAQRTLATAQALAEGMLPGCTAEIHSAGEGKSDPLFDGTEAGAARPDPALSLAAVAGRLGPKPDAVVDAQRPAFDLLVRVLSGNGKPAHSIFEDPVSLSANRTGVTMNGPLNLASTLSEDFLLEYADGMSGDRLGWGRLSVSNLLELMTLHSAYAELMRRTAYLARARGSNLLSYVVRSLEQAAVGKPVAGAAGSPDTALLVISGHDTNLSNLSGMLGLSWLLPSYQPDDTPPGGALIFTLWRSRATGRYSVRLQFAAQTLDQMHDATSLSLANPPAIANVFVPGCSAAGDGYPCTWESFVTTARGAIAPEFVAK
jgi:4-phytase/acid phosphatase